MARGMMKILVGAKGFEPSTPASRTRIKQKLLYPPHTALYGNGRMGRHSALVMPVVDCMPLRRGIASDAHTVDTQASFYHL